MAGIWTKIPAAMLGLLHGCGWKMSWLAKIHGHQTQDLR